MVRLICHRESRCGQHQWSAKLGFLQLYFMTPHQIICASELRVGRIMLRSTVLLLLSLSCSCMQLPTGSSLPDRLQLSLPRLQERIPRLHPNLKRLAKGLRERAGEARIGDGGGSGSEDAATGTEGAHMRV